MAKHIFGGPDTPKKLRCLQEYLRSFSIALREQKFACIYIDAFAGSGTRTEVAPALPLFGEVFAEEITTRGSAQLAIDTDPPLHSILLIEEDEDRFSELKRLAAAHPDRHIIVHNGDANEHVQGICANTRWRERTDHIRGIRGVVFLDPYGMEVSWDTVQAIANTEALDCWYFFPLSGLYRNAPHDPAKLDSWKQASLDRVLGATDWRERWYEHKVLPKDLLEDQAHAVRRTDVDAIEAYVKERLRSTFKGDVLDPVRMYHRSGAPLASLFFAISNPSGAAVKLATKIASHILSSGKPSQS